MLQSISLLHVQRLYRFFPHKANHLNNKDKCESIKGWQRHHLGKEEKLTSISSISKNQWKILFHIRLDLLLTLSNTGSYSFPTAIHIEAFRWIILICILRVFPFKHFFFLHRTQLRTQHIQSTASNEVMSSRYANAITCCQQTLGIYNHASMISKAVILQTTLTTNDI